MMRRSSRMTEAEAALVDAAARGETAVVRNLLAQGAPVDARDDRAAPNGPWDVTPLMRAARAGHLDAVRLLLAAGADVHARNSDAAENGAGRTPLHYAALGRHVPVAAELLQAGAQVDAAGTGAIGTALQDAIEWEPSSALPVRERLAARKAGPDPELCCRIEEFVRFMLSRGTNPDPESGWIPLHCAASRGMTGVMAALLDAGANMDRRDEQGHSAFVPAACKNRTAAARLLIERGLEANLKDHEGYSHLHWAAMNGSLELVEALLRAGAEVNAQNDRGESALDLARDRGFAGIEGALREAGGIGSGAAVSGPPPGPE